MPFCFGIEGALDVDNVTMSLSVLFVPVLLEGDKTLHRDLLIEGDGAKVPYAQLTGNMESLLSDAYGPADAFVEQRCENSAVNGVFVALVFRTRRVRCFDSFRDSRKVTSAPATFLRPQTKQSGYRGRSFIHRSSRKVVRRETVVGPSAQTIQRARYGES